MNFLLLFLTVLFCTCSAERTHSRHFSNFQDKNEPEVQPVALPSTRYVNEVHTEDEESHEPPTPYLFTYDITDDDNNKQFRKESSDGNAVRGSYGYTDANGLYRLVEYIADSKNGFRVKMKSNEPGMNNLGYGGNQATNPRADGFHFEDVNLDHVASADSSSSQNSVNSKQSYPASVYMELLTPPQNIYPSELRESAESSYSPVASAETETHAPKPVKYRSSSPVISHFTHRSHPYAAISSVRRVSSIAQEEKRLAEPVLTSPNRDHSMTVLSENSKKAIKNLLRIKNEVKKNHPNESYMTTIRPSLATQLINRFPIFSARTISQPQEDDKANNSQLRPVFTPSKFNSVVSSFGSKIIHNVANQD